MAHTKQTKNNGGLLDILKKGPHESISYDYGVVRTYYLSEELGDPADYIDWFHEMRNARDSDVIKIVCNCYGGNLFTTIQFMQALSETDAHICVSVEGACMSAATLIFLMADEYQITNHSQFLFHNYSGGSAGKGGEMYNDIINKKKWTETLFAEMYADFLTPEEIKDLSHDKDIWLDANQVLERLEKRGKMIEKKAKKAEKTKKSE